MNGGECSPFTGFVVGARYQGGCCNFGIHGSAHSRLRVGPFASQIKASRDVLSGATRQLFYILRESLGAELQALDHGQVGEDLVGQFPY